MDDDDFEDYDREMELALYREYRDIVGQFRFVVELPGPVEANVSHQLCLRYRLGPGDAMSKHYALTPMTRCDEFRLRVRFPLPAPRVWLLPGLLPRTLDDEPSRPPDVEPDRVGEVTASFANLKIGHAYGFRWA